MEWPQNKLGLGGPTRKRHTVWTSDPLKWAFEALRRRQRVSVVWSNPACGTLFISHRIQTSQNHPEILSMVPKTPLSHHCSSEHSPVSFLGTPALDKAFLPGHCVPAKFTCPQLSSVPALLLSSKSSLMPVRGPFQPSCLNCHSPVNVLQQWSLHSHYQNCIFKTLLKINLLG